MYLAIFLIYIGTCFYTAASFLHLKFKKWTFWRGYLLAIPLVLIEYIFNIYGTKLAVLKGISVQQIMILIFCFYLLNIQILNWLVLQNKAKIELWRELLALILVIAAIKVARIF